MTGHSVGACGTDDRSREICRCGSKVSLQCAICRSLRCCGGGAFAVRGDEEPSRINAAGSVP